MLLELGGPTETVLGVNKLAVATPVCTIETHKEGYSAICANNKWIVVAGNNAKLKVYSENQGMYQLSFTIIAHSNPVYSMYLIDDVLLSGDSTQQPLIKIWNLKDNSMVRALKGHANAISCITHRTPQLIASSSHDRTVRIWELNPSDEKKTILKHQFPILAVLFGKQEDIVYCGGDGCLISIWNWRKAEKIRYYFSHTNSLTMIIRTEKGALFSGGGDGILKQWTFESSEEFLNDNQSNPNSPDSHELALSENQLKCWSVIGNEMVVSDSYNVVYKVDATTKTWITINLTLPYYENISGVALMQDKRLITCSTAGSVRVWAIKEKESETNIDFRSNHITIPQL